MTDEKMATRSYAFMVNDLKHECAAGLRPEGERLPTVLARRARCQRVLQSMGSRGRRDIRNTHRRLTPFLLLVVFVAFPAVAVLNTATNNGYWGNEAIWDNGVPGDGDDVFLPAGQSVTVSNTTAMLSSLVVTNGATLTSSGTGGSGTNIVINATNVSIYGNITHNNNMTSSTNALGVWVPDNGVFIQCSNLLVASGATVHGDQKGYRGGDVSQAGKGPGATARTVNSATGGAGHGGAGGDASSSGGETYGSYLKPLNPGSGSGGDWGGGADGGGMIRIEAVGKVTVDGTISVDGEDGPNRGGGGAGGSIYIACNTIGGSGLITAHGGNCNSQYGSGGGGGGRVSVVYSTTAQSNVASRPMITFGAKQGAGTGNSAALSRWGRPGTVYFPDTSILWTEMEGGELVIPGFTAWAPDRLTLRSGMLILPERFELSVTNDVLISDLGGGIWLTNSTEFPVGGNLVLTNWGCLYLYSGITNGATPDYAMRVGITGNLEIAANSVLYPVSNPTNGGSISMTVSNLFLASGGSINADAAGWSGGSGGQNGLGLGGGQSGTSGGGYGGEGAGAAGGFGGTYGSASAPVYPGSGGGGVGGAGGGLVRIDIANAATIEGTITVNGEDATYGGSGGGICLQAAVFEEAYGTIKVEGGTGSSMGGGGGRVALVYSSSDAFDGTISAAGGTGSSTTGQVGTIYRTFDGSGFSLSVEGHPVRHEVAVPYDYGVHVLPQDMQVTNDIALVAEQTSTSRFYCVGWTLTNALGALIDSGATTQAVFTMSTNLTLTWQWTNQFYLITTASTNGSLQMDRTAWYNPGTDVEITAVPDGTCHFLLWSGSNFPVVAATDNPLTVTMDQARTLEANFYDNTAQQVTWGGTGNWLEYDNWSPPGLPGPDDSVVIPSGSCTLKDPMTVASLSISNGATLTFDGTDYYGTNLCLTMNSGLVDGTLTHKENSAIAMEAGEWVPDNAVYIKGRTFTLGPNGLIDCDKKGFQGGINYKPGNGPGRSLQSGNGGTGGAGYGGAGGDGWSTAGGTTYGDETRPLMPGSGSGADHGGGRDGGGLVRIEVTGGLTINGTISADGEDGSNRGGGGAGGGVYLYCSTIDGNGTVSADGGSNDSQSLGGGGGGGRVAIWSTTRNENLTVSATNGPAIGTSDLGAPGTVVWHAVPPQGTVFVFR